MESLDAGVGTHHPRLQKSVEQLLVDLARFQNFRDARRVLISTSAAQQVAIQLLYALSDLFILFRLLLLNVLDKEVSILFNVHVCSNKI